MGLILPDELAHTFMTIDKIYFACLYSDVIELHTKIILRVGPWQFRPRKTKSTKSSVKVNHEEEAGVEETSAWVVFSTQTQNTWLSPVCSRPEENKTLLDFNLFRIFGTFREPYIPPNFYEKLQKSLKLLSWGRFLSPQLTFFRVLSCLNPWNFKWVSAYGKSVIIYLTNY